MFIALTGTPGTGKTTIASLLQAQGVSVINLHELAIAENKTDGFDSERNSVILDPRKLSGLVKKRFDKKDTFVFDGHISHMLSCMDIVIVLRCRPDVLKQRLVKKGWGKEKIKENLEAEIIDIILCEAVSLHGLSKVFEMETTKRPAEEIVCDILDLISQGFSEKDFFKPGQFDWSDYADDEFLRDV